MVSVGLGGPLIQFKGLIIPVPFSQVDFSYGLTDRISVQAGLNTTSLLFGVAQLRLNGLVGLKNPNGWLPGISFSFQQHLFLDRWQKAFSWYPEPGFHLFWHLPNHRHLLFAGGSGWMEIKTPKINFDDRPFFLPIIQAGYQNMGEKWAWSVESRWIAPNISHQNLVTSYVSPTQSGALGLYFSLSRKF